MASLEEAESLLKGWNIGRSQIFCTSVSQGRTFTLRGVIVEANLHGFIIANSSSGERWVIWFSHVRKFEIDNAGIGHRDISTLRLFFHDGDKITLEQSRAP